jgi:hypothetical protein
MLGSLRLLIVAGAVGALAGAAAGPIAHAQTRPSASMMGVFDRLSVGNQKVARSLHQAQRAGSSATASSVKALTLEELAARHLSGEPWSSVFKEMKAQGLVKERSLGQVVSTYGHLGETGARPGGTVSPVGVGSTGSDGDAGHNGKGGK